jgi:UPF0271 protein
VGKVLEYIDLACDVGESFGVYHYGYDEEVMDFLTSANIACGFHAGDPVNMHITVNTAIRKGVAIGAHPGLPDLLGFGRRMIHVSPSEVCDYIVYQIGAMEAFCKLKGTSLQHVKCHGALARMLATDEDLAVRVVETIHAYNKGLIIVAFAGSMLEKLGLELGMHVASEILVDRAYDRKGNLIAFQAPEAIIREPKLILDQVDEIVLNERIKTIENNYIDLNRIHTVGFHFGTTTIDLVKKIHVRLKEHGIKIRPLGDFLF